MDPERTKKEDTGGGGSAGQEFRVSVSCGPGPAQQDPAVSTQSRPIYFESLILAQDERWRRA